MFSSTLLHILRGLSPPFHRSSFVASCSCVSFFFLPFVILVFYSSLYLARVENGKAREWKRKEGNGKERNGWNGKEGIKNRREKEREME